MDIIVPTCEESVTDPSFGNVTYDKIKYYTFDPSIESDEDNSENEDAFTTREGSSSTIIPSEGFLSFKSKFTQSEKTF
jgi:hypothetical protein